MGNYFQKQLYNRILLPATYGVFSVAAAFHSKLRETFRGHRDVRKRWTLASESINGDRPVWFHVSSVGEYEQAKPVITALAREFPQIPVAVSFTSPSGLKYASHKETIGNGSNIKFMDYLPIDFVENSRFCLDTINPRLLVFVKFDLWPNLIWEATAKRVPTVLIDATLSKSSYRCSRLGRSFYRAVYDDLDEILAISEQDAERFKQSIPEHQGITVMGDTRFDRVVERKRSTNANGVADIDTEGRFVIIAGSTWPKDEVHLLDARQRLSNQHKNLLIILAPHEPTKERVDALLGWARAYGLTAATLSNKDDIKNANGNASILVVDSVGVLAEIYKVADVAYVGGSFSTGVHSVIEPAIMGIPIVFGPVHNNSFEALKLLSHEAAVEVSNGKDILNAFNELIQNDVRRINMGTRAKSFVESQLGATSRCMATIRKYLEF